MNRLIAAGLVALAFSLSATPASAHRVGESYIIMSSFPDRIEGRVEATYQDLSAVLPLDTDGDGKVSDAEFTPAIPAIQEYVSSHLALTADGVERPITWTVTEEMTTDHGMYAVVRFQVPGTVAQELGIEYTGFFDALPEHRGLFIIEYEHSSGTVNDSEAVSLVFTPRRTHQVIDPTSSSSMAEFVAFVREGIHHIWIGVDHILFLVVLILPSVMTRRDGRWQPVESFRPAFIHVVKVVTIFTLAHSITLSLAALGVVNLNSRLVESIIAASVVFAAINGAFFGRGMWPIIFAFGLFHGFGFASVLGHLAIDRRFLVPALFGFNVGVEIGQVAIICATFPVLWFLRQWNLYSPVVLKAGSTAIAVLAFIWLWERAFDVTVLGLF